MACCARHDCSMELMVSMVSATLLLAGLASCLFIALRAFDGSSAAAVRSRAAETQAEMLIDLGEATSFSNRSVDSVTFKVPDRDGDGDEETIAYSWTLATKELSYSTPNADGIYIVDAAGGGLTIRDCRIVGTLVVQNVGTDVTVEDFGIPEAVWRIRSLHEVAGEFSLQAYDLPVKMLVKVV